MWSQAPALAAVAVNSLTAATTYRRMGLVDTRSGLLFAAAAIPGSVAAPFVLSSVGGTRSGSCSGCC